MKKNGKKPPAKTNGHTNGATPNPPTAETFKRRFEFTLSKTEQVERNTELLTVLDRLERARTERLSAMSNYKTLIDSLNERKNELRIALRTRTEEREVDCLERRNDDARTVETVRLDKQAIVDVRPMIGAELQLELPTGKKKKGRAAEAMA